MKRPFRSWLAPIGILTLSLMAPAMARAGGPTGNATLARDGGPVGNATLARDGGPVGNVLRTMY